MPPPSRDRIWYLGMVLPWESAGLRVWVRVIRTLLSVESSRLSVVTEAVSYGTLDGNWSHMHRGALVAAILLIAASAYGQSGATTGSLSGVVQDLTGGVLVDAVVTATYLDTNTVRTARTDDHGRYAIAGLSPGAYAVSALAPAFVRVTTGAPVTIIVGKGTTADFTLTQVEAPGATVQVNAPAPFADPVRTVVSSTVARGEIDGLPINIRDPISFAFLAPGVSTDRTPQQGSSATSGMTFAGQRARSNNVLADGVDSNDSTVGGVRSVLPQDAVDEFQVLTSGYSAEFGKASGGVVGIVTRHGANNHTGTAFFLFRDDALSAKEYFERFSPAGQPIDRPKAPYGQQQFGASGGGPLRRDRTFYFAAFEGLRVQANNFVTIDDTTPVTLFGQSLGTPADIIRRAGFPIETGHVPYDVRTNKIFGRVDQVIGPSDNLNVRVNWATDYNENSESWGGEVARSRGGVLEAHDFTGAATHLHSWQQSLNELRTQLVYRDQTVLALDPACSGPCDGNDEGGPTLELAGVASVGRQRFTPQPRETLRFQASDVFSVSHRRGFLKLGGDYNAINHPSGSIPLHFGGRYIFSPLPAIPGLLPESVSAIQALALGLPAAYVQGYGNPASQYLVQDLSLFAQDEWRIRDVTMHAGVRFQTQMLPDISYAVKGLDPYTFPEKRNVAPRLAAVWTPAPRTSIHGGYGRFYDIHVTSLPGVTDVVDGSAEGVRTLVAPFPNSIAAWNAPGHRLSENAVGPFPSLAITASPTLTTPYSDQSTIGFTQELKPSLEFSADYIHVRGNDQVGTLDYNPVRPGARSQSSSRRSHRQWGADCRVVGVAAAVHELRSYVVRRRGNCPAPAIHRTVPVADRLHGVEGGRQLYGLSERVSAAGHG